MELKGLANFLSLSENTQLIPRGKNGFLLTELTDFGDTITIRFSLSNKFLCIHILSFEELSSNHRVKFWLSKLEELAKTKGKDGILFPDTIGRQSIRNFIKGLGYSLFTRNLVFFLGKEYEEEIESEGHWKPFGVLNRRIHAGRNELKLAVTSVSIKDPARQISDFNSFFNYHYHIDGQTGHFRLRRNERDEFEIQDIQEKELIVTASTLSDVFQRFAQKVEIKRRIENLYDPPRYHFDKALMKEPFYLSKEVRNDIHSLLLKKTSFEQIEWYFALNYSHLTC